MVGLGDHLPMIINLFAGPGAGKSTLAHGLMYELKMRGEEVEFAGEYAKDLTWEERLVALRDQPYIFGKQYHRLFRLSEKVDYVVTDSPLLLSLIYGNNFPASFKMSVRDLFNSFCNVNFFVVRNKPYKVKGRNQTEGEARILDEKIRALLSYNAVPFTEVTTLKDILDEIP